MQKNMDTDKDRVLHYNAIDKMRMCASFGIIAMHVLANGNYVFPESGFSGFLSQRLIPSFTDFVFLFMVISAFGMCCGYYDKMIRGELNLLSFYRKRYAKIWPFFAALCVLDVIISPGKTAVYELLANLTLCFGLLPNAAISVIGVGWFIGVIFVFYMLFPFFCCLISTKKKAWISFGGAVVFHTLCSSYFLDAEHVTEGFVARTNFVYCAMFFFAGGLIYLYKDKVTQLKHRKKIFFIMCILGIIFYYKVSRSTYILLFLFTFCLIYGIGSSRKKNPFVKFVSGISMEMYLCHMAILRVIEKTGLSMRFGNGWVQYVINLALTIAGSILFSITLSYLLRVAGKRLQEIRGQMEGN